MRGADARRTVGLSAPSSHSVGDGRDAAFLAAALDDEIVLLDVAQGQLVLLDAAAALVWRTCDPAATTPGATEGRRAAGVLRRLARAGAVIRNGELWVQVPVRWV